MDNDNDLRSQLFGKRTHEQSVITSETVAVIKRSIDDYADQHGWHGFGFMLDPMCVVLPGDKETYTSKSSVSTFTRGLSIIRDVKPEKPAA